MQVLELERKEQAAQTRRILSRMIQSESSALEEGGNQEVLSEEELMQLLHVLEKDDDEELVRFMSGKPAVAAAFQRAIPQLVDDGLLVPWYPWWRTKLLTGKDDSPLEMLGKGKTLDERILAIPSFEILRPSSNAKQVADLRFNLVDLLYSTAWTLRLYHGRDNALDTPIAAFDTLQQSSAVLSQDARFTSLEEVLVDCTRRSTQQVGGDCNAAWNVLAQDVALLCQSRRLTARALLEAADLVKEACRESKKKGHGDDTSRIRRTRKKIEYYLSWCQAVELSSNLSREIEDWVAHWKQTDPDQLDALSELELPRRNAPDGDVARADATQMDGPLLFKEIESRQL
jgi:hypothetical protein